MKGTFVARLQNLGRRAEQLRQAVETAPAQAARLREAVTLTATQLQQVRAEVQTGLADLRADTGDRLLASLTEIHGATGILREAGFELTGIDLELGPAAGQRLLLQLRRFADVSPATVKAVALAHPDLPVLGSVLAALQRALELGERVTLPDLPLQHVLVTVGPAPNVRIGWRAVSAEAATNPAVTSSATTCAPPTLPPPGTTANPPTPAPPILGSVASVLFPTSPPNSPSPASTATPMAVGSADLQPLTPLASSSPAGESRSAAAAPSTASATSSSAAAVSAEPSRAPAGSTAARSLAANWREGALDRFKSMPNLTKR